MGEGDECVSFIEDAIDDAIERIEGLLSDFEDRDILSRLSDFAVPCAAGLVCRRETLERSVCVPENMNGQSRSPVCMYRRAFVGKSIHSFHSPWYNLCRMHRRRKMFGLRGGDITAKI